MSGSGRVLRSIGFVVPVFNEEETLRPFHQALAEVVDRLDLEAEILYVDDGSRDGSRDLIKALQQTDDRIRLVGLSRNFGKEAALSAGLARVRGDVVVPIDADLQHPPQVVERFIERWREGYDVVYGVRGRHADSRLKGTTGRLFYRFFNTLTREKIPVDAGDFRLMDRKVVEALRDLPERNRFMKGLFAWVGFRSIGVEFVSDRRLSGKAKFNARHLWRLALDGITGFSTLPLRIWTYVGLAVAAFAFVFGVVEIVITLVRGIDTPGYASLMVVILFLGGIQLISLGVIGEYLGRMFVETKQRPLYVIDEEA